MTIINGWDSDLFWSKVDKVSAAPCWVWTATRDRKNYGRINLKNLTGSESPKLAHRASWFLETGSWPEADEFVLHRCDNPPCVRPAHLFLGSAADNSADMVAKGRSPRTVVPWESRTHGERNAQAILTAERVIELRKRALAGEHFRDLAPEFGIAPSTANGIINGNAWRHVWPYDTDNPPVREIRRRARRRSRN